MTLTGSLIAWAKLKDLSLGSFKISPALTFKGQKTFNILLLFTITFVALWFTKDPDLKNVFYFIIGLSALLGIMTVIPIGGADMPVVISLLNSYSGLAACAAGFIINNTILIVAGSMVGASGIILTSIMCKAMNRSLNNILFSGFGSPSVGGKNKDVDGEANPISAQDCYYLLESANSVAVVPGYGLAVAQAQHAVRELGECLEANGTEVSYAIHPVAGRMPGHMNVLLAEADVPYDQLIEMDDINPVIESIDVVLVIGANDVVNPDAREDEDSPIYGMPIINVDHAKTVIVLKRSMSVGFAGIQNPLFFKENTRMLFGDAKGSANDLIAEFKG